MANLAQYRNDIKLVDKVNRSMLMSNANDENLSKSSDKKAEKE